MNVRVTLVLVGASAWVALACAIGCGGGVQSTEARTVATHSPRDRAALDDSVATLRPVVEGFVAEHAIPGLAVALVRGVESTTIEVGHARDGVACTASTVFEIGSVTKVFTSLLLADMVVRGEVTLDEPVASLLPDMHVPAHDGHTITLQHLATHTSGLGRLPPDFAPANPADPYADFDEEHLRSSLAHTTLSRDPGDSYAYSNFGGGLLGFALGKRLGLPYADALTRRVLLPLGLRDTGVAMSPNQQARAAQGHDSAGHVVPPWTLSALAGAGALHSTLADMVTFVQANLEPRGELADALRLAQLPRADAAEIKGAIALGWHVVDRGRTLFHNGQTAGFHSFVAIDRGARVGVVLLTNVGDGAIDELGTRLLGALRGDRARPAQPPPTPSVTVSPEQMDALVGTYALAPTFRITVRRTPQGLEAQATNQPALRLEARSATEWSTVGVDAQLTFVLGTDGRAVRLVLHQDGRDAPGDRE